MNSTIFVLFNKYCPIVDQLGSKDSSCDLQLNCVISYFFTYIYYFMHKSKDWYYEESEKNSNFCDASKRGADSIPPMEQNQIPLCDSARAQDHQQQQSKQKPQLASINTPTPGAKVPHSTLTISKPR
jgi:hypothetical protein